MSRVHTLNPTPQTVHWGHFDASIASVLEIDSGDTVIIDTVSGGRGEITDDRWFRPEHLKIVNEVKQTLGPHILTGPVSVRGALPGDTLEIQIESIELTEDWGWNIIRPLKGALPERFSKLSRRIIPIDRQAGVARLPWGVDVPLQPFFGIIEVAPPPHYGRVSSIEPREYGGNIDCKEFTPGTSLFLPIFVPGGHVSVGDGHAVQGDGEVCLTALETCLRGRFRIVLHRDELSFPRAITPTHYITLGMNVDLDDAASQALNLMVDWLVELKAWDPEEAYVFCSLACDLHVTQLVDGNKGIHAMVSRQVLGL